jgi:branched-chain amino acid transport system permease protein
MGEQLLNALINGILLGGVFALLALGLNLIFGVVKIIHLAYGQFVMIGFYLVYLFYEQAGLPIALAIFLAIVAMGAIGFLTQFVVIKPLLNAPRLNQLLALASLIIVFENFALFVWGADYRGIPFDLPIIEISNIFIRTSSFIAFLGALFVMGALYLFLNKTYLGLAIRAVSQDTDVAKLMGINPSMIYYVTMALGGVLTAVVAAFFVPIYTVHPHFGSAFTLTAFIIVVLGGMGNLLGGFIGAFMIGIITSVAAVLTSTEVAEIVVLVIFILVMLIRPQGILGSGVSS